MVTKEAKVKEYKSLSGIWIASLVIFSILMITMTAGDAFSATTLNWTAPTTNTDGTPLIDLAGYKVYYGTASGQYTNSLNVGKVNTYVFNNLTSGTTYYFAATAYDTSGIESVYSNQVIKTELAASDTSPPSVIAFSLPSTSTSITVPITSITATDNVGITGYMVTQSSNAPSATASGWSAAAPTSYTVSAAGSYTLYAWVKDAAGNVSTSKSASVTVSVSISGTTITLTPAADTFINLDTSVNSTATQLNTYTWPAQEVANAILMQFDLSSIPAGATIQSVTLNIYLLDSDTDTTYSTYSLSMNRIINHNPDLSKATGYTYDGTNSWTSNTLAYNNIPMGQADISAAYDTKVVDKTLGFKTWNATQLIKDWIASPSTNYGLMINSDPAAPSDTYRYFASSNNATASIHPYLTVTYK